MRKLTTILSLVLINSTSFAATNECSNLLGSLIEHVKEGTRLNSAAIHHGFNIHTGEVTNIDKQSKNAKKYLELSEEYLQKAKTLELELKQNCLK